ncbi:MAG: DUF3685 domain-containing protein [Synechococcaceae cyanobacterium ELA739]
MTRRDPTVQPQLLVFAEPLQRDGLLVWLAAADQGWITLTSADELKGAPQLVLWSLKGSPAPQQLSAELEQLQERWQPAPLLLLLPQGHPYSRDFLLQLPLQGLLEAPDAAGLRQAVATLLGGGRVVEIGEGQTAEVVNDGALGLGQWLLISGLHQIDAEIRLCRRLLDPPPATWLAELLLLGRLRELTAARQLLLWLWGPMGVAWPGSAASRPEPGAPAPSRGVAITLRQRTADGLWQALRERLNQSAEAPASRGSAQLLALDGLQPDRRRDLLLALVEQFEQLRQRLQQDGLGGEVLLRRWQDLQPELRRQALRRMAGTYVQLPWQGNLRPVASTLMEASELSILDGDLPDPVPMLGTLIQARPLLVEGRLLAPDEPQALLYLELLLNNWLVRSAELISAEVLAVCADWPELRRYLLRPELLATRSLERLRNQLNARQRWSTWFERPIQVYESRRPLYRLEQGAIETVDLLEPRDQELRQLGWLQQGVTLALESRDALAPQLRSLVRGLGALLVMLLTQVVGRAIGLIGRGILQGMGRSVGRG